MTRLGFLLGAAYRLPKLAMGLRHDLNDHCRCHGSQPPRFADLYSVRAGEVRCSHCAMKVEA